MIKKGPTAKKVFHDGEFLERTIDFKGCMYHLDRGYQDDYTLSFRVEAQFKSDLVMHRDRAETIIDRRISELLEAKAHNKVIVRDILLSL